ncbi:MAG TPA: SpoIIE family protein phosphatase, partial [Bacteroidia bacterium]|nr:SpoIIE family protein phosphatase [Bacteroidia bacterium]
KKDAVAEQQRKKQIIIRNALLAGFALVLALVFFIFRGYRQKKKAYDIITRQKEEVTKSRKKVMDSINYAQKIQYSLLPSGEEIRKYMADYFVCFMPKDVVSGDFYWFHHTDDCSYMAVVDCTGHGVPGAFMSMLANSFLNEIVIEKQVSDPAEILAQMHEHVFKTLRQQKGDEYSQDGMDISLVVIDHKKGTAKFAGAKNNGFVIDGQKITTLKATPKSIGGLSMIGEVEPTRQFKSEVFEVKKGILLVLSTDGIFDQLNASDEKFGKARFNELVQGLYSMDMQQGQLLAENTVNEWKTGMNQQDDILLLSVKI